MASIVYSNWLLKGYDASTKINLASGGDTLKIALVTSTYAPNQATHDFFDDVTNETIGSTGYTSGGNTLTSQTCTLSSTTLKFDANDPAWTTSTITARGAVVYKSTGVASTSPLICYIDFGADYASVGGTFAITFATAGIVNIT